MATRYYKNSKGEKVPSASSVLPKPYLARWAANRAVDYLWENSPKWPIDGNDNTVLALRQDVTDKARTAFERESKKAAGYGTFTHWMWEKLLVDGVFIIPKTWTVPDDKPWELEIPQEMTKKFTEGLVKWIDKHKVKVIAMEHVVITDTYGGRLDLVCEMWLDGKWQVVIIDFKTGKGTYYDTWKFQLAGYRQAWNYGIVEIDTKNRTYLEGGEVRIDGRVYDYNPEIKNSLILKFNKQTMKVNHKSFNEYSATRTNLRGEKEKYTRTYEMDKRAFNDCVRLWWSTNRGMEI